MEHLKTFKTEITNIVNKKKENKATAQSKRRIREAYLQLLQENENVNKDIRIVEIVKRANINRGTFYAYYPSVDALERDTAEVLINKILEPIRENALKDILLSPYKYIELVANNIENNIDIYKKFESTRYADDFIHKSTLEFLEKAKKDKSLKEFKELIGDEKVFNFTVLAILNGIIGVARECLRGTIDIPKGQFTEYVNEAVKKLIMYVKELDKFDNVINSATGASGDYNA